MALVKTGTTHNNSFNGSLSRATLVTWYKDKMFSLTPSLSVCGYSTVSQRNVLPLTCYNLDTHDLITIIFGRSVTSKKSDDALFACFSITFQRGNPEDSTLLHCACNTVQLLQRSRLPFSWTTPPNSSEPNALITRFSESYSSVSMSRESKRLKKSSSDWLNSGNALIQHLSENAIFMFPQFCQVVQKHKLFEVAQ